MLGQPTDLVVFRVRSRDARCSECGEELGRGGLLRKEGERGLCMECSELGDLLFLPSGNTSLTRRASKHSPLRAVVVEWSRSRKRYERQGILVAEEAIARAEQECLADEEIRMRQRARNAERREVLDAQYVASFAATIREHYPRLPSGIEEKIAAHACRKYSGRVGRSAAAKELFEPEPPTALPRCIGGKRSGPPEDVGGPHGYAENLAALANPRHPRHREFADWFPRDFDPERFDLESINQRLQALGKRRPRSRPRSH